jgi:hypothetical protein
MIFILICLIEIPTTILHLIKPGRSLLDMMYHLFPGDKETPNMGVLLFFCLIPISLFYAIAHVIRHFNSSENYFKCLVIHVAVWVSIIAYLNAFAK